MGANLFEATSYSPPYWMTISGTAKGGEVVDTLHSEPSSSPSLRNWLAAAATE